MAREIVPDVDEFGELVIPPSVVARNADVVTGQHRIASFRGRAVLLDEEPYPHFVPLHKDRFERIAYPLLGGISRSKMGDVFAYLGNTVEDLTLKDNLIWFGASGEHQIENAKPIVWDMEGASATAYEPDNTIWRSPYPRYQSPSKEPERVEFIMQLAGGDEGLYDDIMQSLAPLIMTKKPDGVIWWVGDGANGKSTLMDAIYRIFPGQLSSINVKRLTDGRDTPSLNGTLANVVKESSEGRIDDTEIYKSIGTHENFRVHKFHSQDDIEIRGNLHHIFSGNSIPAFNDKGYSARRRTFIVPFNETFVSDPDFERKTFTPEFFAHLVGEMCRYAQQIKKQGYRYKWSAATLAAKANYDIEANSAEEYVKAVIAEGIVAFDSFQPFKIDYENWCGDHGYVPLGMGNLRRAAQALGFDRVTHHNEAGPRKHYRLPTVSASEVQPLGMGRPGIYTTSGFRSETAVAKKEIDETIPKSIIKDRW